GLEPMPQRIRTGWDDPLPRVLTPAVPWSTGQTPAPAPALAPTVVESVVANAGDPAPVLAVPETPGVPAWGSPPGVGEMERAMRSVPLGLEPVPAVTPRVETPSPPGVAGRIPTPSSSPLPRLHRPPTPPSSPVALHPGEESPLVVAARGVALAHPGATPASMPRLLLLGGLTVLGAAFLGTTLWVRVGAPSREPLHRPAPVPRAVDETELDRLLAQARERIDAHDDAGAEEAAMRAAAVDPSDARAYLLLGRIALRLGNAPRARSELERVLSLEPSGTRADEARALLSSIP
ncbi:MAG: hypothetical protein ACXWK6_13600, partial [Myxococcaceae bacterium]